MIVFSTISVMTSFLAAALTMLRSSYYAPGYAAKENPAYLPVAVNFLIFFFQRPLRIPLPEKAGVRSVLTEFSSMQKGAADFRSAAPLICFSRKKAIACYMSQISV